ncbi:MAG TPA: nucleotide sugar dehydrogenase [Gemmatimonadales bacterium]|nr:nucleotide sugar dehydrogenase [Gemmatimonadales bacterium]
MNISVFGLGYVGAVTAGCLAKRGHSIVGVDVQPQKVELFNAGVPPIVEPGLAELLKEAKDAGLLKATTSAEEAICDTEVSIICVGTPSKVTGGLDLSYVRGVAQQIADGLRNTKKRHTLVLRSTMLPGSTEQIVGETLSDLTSTGRVQVFYFPEFLREGTAVADFEHPSLAVVGTSDGASPPAELTKALLGETAVVVNWPTAEMVKYACNAFHATKISFANEIGRVAKEMGLDARVVMDLLCQDTKLNLSPYYLKPGNPFGGSCLPKDVRALASHARVQGLSVPVLENLLLSNERHLQSLLGLVSESGHTEICILGLAFKSNTDDLREAPMVEVAQTLLGRGFKVRIYDPALNLAALVGANKRVIDMRMPHLASLLCPDLATALGARGLVVAAQQCAPIADLKRYATAAHHVLDVNGWPELRELPWKYEGLCW